MANVKKKVVHTNPLDGKARQLYQLARKIKHLRGREVRLRGDFSQEIEALRRQARPLTQEVSVYQGQRIVLI